jgi:hypothetical protein
MTRARFTVSILALTATVAAVSPAPAAQVCPAGRTVSGECADPNMSDAMRKTAIAYSQPKFSYTAPARQPIEDRSVYIAPHWHELFNIFYYPPVHLPVSTSPKP